MRPLNDLPSTHASVNHSVIVLHCSAAVTPRHQCACPSSLRKRSKLGQLLIAPLRSQMANGQRQIVMLYVLMNLAFASLACLFVVTLAPTAAGSGVPDLMAYLNNADIAPGFLSFSTFVIKARISICCVR